MLAIVLALASALAYGVSDYAAGLASRDFSVIQVTLVSAAASTLVVVAVLPLRSSPRCTRRLPSSSRGCCSARS
jgi:hypothetical protein